MGKNLKNTESISYKIAITREGHTRLFKYKVPTKINYLMKLNHFNNNKMEILNSINIFIREFFGIGEDEV